MKKKTKQRKQAKKDFSKTVFLFLDVLFYVMGWLCPHLYPLLKITYTFCWGCFPRTKHVLQEMKVCYFVLLQWLQTNQKQTPKQKTKTKTLEGKGLDF